MSIQEFKPVKEGKVREVFDNGDSMIIVATDRISAFDVILKNKITQKGAILTQMSKFWFEFTKDIVPNHMLSTNVADMPEFFRKEEFDGNSMKCKKLQMLPVECIVRGYITGSGWGELSERGHGLRHPPARRTVGIRTAARTHLYADDKGGPRSSRRAHYI